MSGHENYNFEKFRKIEERLRREGNDVISGRTLFESEIKRGIVRKHADYLRMSIKLMLAFESDALCLLNGWEESEGAKSEVAVGLSLGMRFIDEDGDFLYPQHVEDIWAANVKKA